MTNLLRRLDLRLQVDGLAHDIALFRPAADDPRTRFYAISRRWCVAIPRADEHACRIALRKTLSDLGVMPSPFRGMVAAGQRLARRLPMAITPPSRLSGPDDPAKGDTVVFILIDPWSETLDALSAHQMLRRLLARPEVTALETSAAQTRPADCWFLPIIP